MSRGLTRCRLDVTLTIDSAVLHFYPEEGFDSTVNVEVYFRTGVFTHYFPGADVLPAPGSNHYSARLDGFELPGELSWKGVRVKAAAEGRTVGAPAWLVRPSSEAATVEVNGDQAKFLMYRGIGCRWTEPLKLSRAGPELVVTTNGARRE